MSALGWACVLTCVLACTAPAEAQTAAGATPPQRYVAIGCISRAPRTAAGTPAGRGSPGPVRYLLTDARGDRPSVYRLEGGDAAMLEFHVGHTVEIAGPLTVGQGSAAPLTLKVGSLTYVSTSCKNPTAK